MLDKKSSKGNYSYTLGAGPTEGEGKHYQEIEGNTYMVVGKALNTKIAADLGSIVRVKIDQVKKDGERYIVHSAKVIEVPEAVHPDKIITLELLSNDEKKSLKEVVIGFALIKSCGIADSISKKVDIFSFTVLSILKRPILNWFSTNSPTDLTLLFPRWSISSTSPLPSLKPNINLIIETISAVSRTVFLSLVSKFNLKLSLTLPTSYRSYLSFLKYKLLNISSAISTDGASPGLNTL